MATLEALRDKEHRHNKFLAALQGVDLDAASKEESMKRVVAEMERIEAEQGISAAPRKNDFSTFGIAVVEGD